MPAPHHSVFLQAGCRSCRPTNSVKALKVFNIIYILRQIFARYGIPLELVTGNSPFNSAELKAFAGRWEFIHTTSSPHYTQSNGKSEAAVKQVKRLMDKAHEDRSDPYLALLALPNTPSESLGLSPAQIMFNRRTRRTLPMAQTLLSGVQDKSAHDALVQSKQRQAAYYNRGAKDRPVLKVGDTVRTRWKSRDVWQKAKVIKALPHRSYELQMGRRFDSAWGEVRFGVEQRCTNECEMLAITLVLSTLMSRLYLQLTRSR